jgi:protein Tex
MMDYDKKIASTINISPDQVAVVIKLLDQGNTLPFVARYRKEATGGLDEEQLRAISEWLGKLRSLDERRNTVINTVEEQGKLTPELHQQLLDANSLTLLEDLYQPYKPKRYTRASIARDKGLQGLADLILQQAHVQESLEKITQPYLSENVPATEDAWAGARDIVAETISDHAEVRRITRERVLQWGVLHSEKIPEAEDERRVYEVYYE